MIRITGGQWRGRYIDSPKTKDIRPTTGLVRESLFSRIQSQLQGARFLDLFAGSGLIGIEALSRGATYVLAVEKTPAHFRLIENNYAKLGISSTQSRILRQDALALAASPNPEGPFDIAYLDPPYGFPALETITQHLIINGWVTGLIIIEQSSREPNLTGIHVKSYIQKNFGETRLNFLEI